MDIKCILDDYTFRYGGTFYCCIIQKQIIHEDQELKFVLEHEDGRTNNDVQMVYFGNFILTKIPQGLTKTFPNLRVLYIMNSNCRRICKVDLAEYKNLEKFLLENSELEFLPGDLFEDFKDLKFVSFEGNKLEIVEPNILDGLNNLELVDFQPNYIKCFSLYPVYNPNATLEEVKNELNEKFFSKFKLLQDLKNSEEHLAQQVQQLKDSEEKLQTDLENEKLKNSKMLLNFQKGIFVELSNFIQDETTKDFRIIIDYREFPVHKFLLAARSPTLAEILRNNPEVENLNLVDISVEIFEKILKFIYTDELPCKDGTNFLHLFAAAGKLKIEELKNYGAMNLIEIIDEENVMEILKLSNKYEHEELRQKSFEKIKVMYPRYGLKDMWASDHEILMKFIEQFKRNEEAIQRLEEELTNARI